MANKKKALTVDEYLHLKPTQVRSIAKNKTEMAKAVSTMRAVAVKRYEREVKVETSSPAVNSLKTATRMKNNGVVTRQTMFPSVRNMTLQQLQSEYNKYKSYLTDVTSTSKGLNEEFQRIRDNMGIGDIKLNQKQMTQFLDIWNQIRYKTGFRDDRFKYDETMSEIATDIKNGKDINEILRETLEKLGVEYEEREMEYTKQSSLSKIF